MKKKSFFFLHFQLKKILNWKKKLFFFVNLIFFIIIFRIFGYSRKQCLQCITLIFLIPSISADRHVDGRSDADAALANGWSLRKRRRPSVVYFMDSVSFVVQASALSVIFSYSSLFQIRIRGICHQPMEQCQWAEFDDLEWWGWRENF